MVVAGCGGGPFGDGFIEHRLAEIHAEQARLGGEFAREGKGHVVSALMVATEDQLFLIADSGVTIRVPVDGISEQGRDASGVRVMNLDDDSHVVAVARVLQSDDDDDGVGGDVPADELAADAASEDGTVTEAD